MEKYIKDLEKVYTRTKSYLRTNKKLIEAYRNNPGVDSRNSLLIQNIWLLNYISDKIIRRYDLSESLKPDILGDAIAYFLEILDNVINNSPDKYFSRRIYTVIYNHVFSVYIKEQKLEFFEDLDYLLGEENNQKNLDIEDFWTDLEEIKDKVVWTKKWSSSQLKYIPRNTGIPDRSWMLLMEYIKNNQNFEELGWEFNLSRERVRQLIEEAILNFRESQEINELRKYL